MVIVLTYIPSVIMPKSSIAVSLDIPDFSFFEEKTKS
jgi:hypothetical protein